MNTLQYLNKLEDKSLGAVRAALYALSIKTGYDKENRMILFPESRGENVIGKMNNESNGLVVDINPEEKNSSIKCLAIPMPYLRRSEQMKKDSIINEWNENTQIFECREGTNVVLYWFAGEEKSPGRWCIATAKGIEVNNLKWNSGKTYQEMLFECASSEIGGEYANWEQFCGNLNKQYSYCLGFWHPDFHVLQDSFPRVWINRVYDRETFKDVTQDIKKPEFEVIKPVEFKGMTSNEVCTDSVRCMTPNEIIDVLQSDCDKSEEKKNLGYMVRGLTNGDVLFESKLQSTVNDLYYNAHFTKSTSLTSYDRHNYVLLANYVNGNRDLFAEIFTRFAEEFKRFDKEIESLVQALELVYRKSKQNTVIVPSTKYLQIAYEIKKNIDQLIKINVDDKLFRTTIMSALYHPNHFDALYRLMFL